MEQPAAALHTLALTDTQIVAILIIVMGLIVAIVGSLALLMKRNQDFISDFTTSSDK